MSLLKFYRFEIVTDDTNIRRIGIVWREVVQRTPVGPFGLPAFFDAWRVAFASEKQAFLVVGYLRAEPVLILPMWRACDAPEYWHSLGAFRADYTESATDKDAARAFWVWLTREAPCRSASIARCPAASVLASTIPGYAYSRRGRALAALRSFARSGRARYLSASRNDDYLYADRQRIEQLATRIDSKNVKRKLGILSANGPVSYEAVRGAGAVTALLPELFDMHRSTLHEKGHVSQFEQVSERTFYHGLAAHPELEAFLYMDVLRVGNRPAALHLGFQTDDCIYWYKPAYKRELSRGSPGMVLLAHMFARAARERVQKIDLLKGVEDYKTLWANRMQSSVTVRLRWADSRDLVLRMVHT